MNLWISNQIWLFLKCKIDCASVDWVAFICFPFGIHLTVTKDQRYCWNHVIIWRLIAFITAYVPFRFNWISMQIYSMCKWFSSFPATILCACINAAENGNSLNSLLISMSMTRRFFFCIEWKFFQFTRTTCSFKWT